MNEKDYHEMKAENDRLQEIEDELKKLDTQENELQLHRQSLMVLKKKLSPPKEWNHELGLFLWRGLFFHPEYANASPEWFEFHYSYKSDTIYTYPEKRSSWDNQYKLYSNVDGLSEDRIRTINLLRNNTLDGTVELYQPEKLNMLHTDLQAYLQEKMK